MTSRLRFDVSRRQLLQSLGLGAAAGPLIPLLNASAQTAHAAQAAAAVLHARRRGGAGLQPEQHRRLEADRDRDGVHVARDPRAARAVQVEDRRPLGPDDDRGRRRRAARVRDGGAVDGRDAARAERRRRLRRRQRPPTGWGSGAVDRSDRRAGLRAEHAVPARRQRRDAGDALPQRRARRAVRQPDRAEPHDLHGRQPADPPRDQPEGGVRPSVHGRARRAGCSRRWRIRRSRARATSRRRSSIS